MVYRAIGIVSGSSLNGLDIAFAELQESSGKWSAEIIVGERIPYDNEWKEQLRNAGSLSVFDYHALHIAYGKYLAAAIGDFIDRYQLHFKTQLIAFQGHTSIYKSDLQMCAQLGDPATISALTGINVVSDVRSVDLALGGRGAPVFPVAEKLLFTDNNLFLHIGSNANIALHHDGNYKSFDVCPANRILDLVAQQSGKAYDANGAMAAEGTVDINLLNILNDLEYYHLPLPKTLSADFATDVLYPLISPSLSVEDALRTVCEHIADHVAAAVTILTANQLLATKRLFVTGGGANNQFLVERVRQKLAAAGTTVVVPDPLIINFKEPLAIALIGVLRWREENNVFAYITGASRDSIGGSVWIGQEA